jgi:GT2 family glycosyltransferase
MPQQLPQLTIGIATRNREDALFRTLRSLEHIAPYIGEIIIADEASEPPVGASLTTENIGGVARFCRVVRQEQNEGYIVARNRIAEMAAFDFMLSLDDDVEMIDHLAVESAIRTITSSDSIAAIAFAQGASDGQAWPPPMQPAPVAYPCIVPSFLGFAALIRRSAFQSVGGYREIFHYYSEEKELGLRLMDRGFQIVYLPEAIIIHHISKVGRTSGKGQAYGARNDCFSALFNLPFPMMAAMILRSLYRYGRTDAQTKGTGFGMIWVLNHLRPHVWDILINERAPVKVATLQLWRRVKRENPPFISRQQVVD